MWILLFCLICKLSEESVEHLLFFCNHARDTWFGSHLGFNHNLVSSGSILDWWNKILALNNTCNKKVSMFTSFLCWYMWKTRNEAIFNSTTPNPELSIKKAQNALEEMQSMVVQQPHSQPNCFS